MNTVFEEGMIVYLKVAYRGHRAARLIRREQYRWLVELCGNGLELEFYEDEFEFEK